MAFQIHQTLTILIYICIGIGVWKVKKKKLKIVLVIIAIALFFINPIKFKQEGMSKIEMGSNCVEIELPERIAIKKKSFDEKQTNEMEKLKSESKEIVKNEINY